MNIRYVHQFSLLNQVFLFLLLQTLFMSTVCAQEIVVKDIPSLDKLPVKAIHRIFQDSDGYIWYGTFNGLCRSDGYDVRVFRSDLFHHGLLDDNYITYINEDHEKHIWFGTFQGAYILDKATYRITPVNMGNVSDRNVFSINVTRDGTIWVSTSGSLFRYEANGELLKRYPVEYNHSSQFVYTVYEDKDDHLLISITQGGMYKLNKETDSFEPYFHHEEYRDIEKIIWDETHQCYWLGTWGKGIIRFNPEEQSPERQYIPQPLPVDVTGEATGDTYHMVQDDVYHYLWVTTKKDLFAFRITKDKMLEQVDTSSFLTPGNKMLYEIYKDRDGKLWVSAFDMESFIIDIRKHFIKKYTLPALREQIKANPAIISLCMDSKGVFWFSQERYGLYIYDSGTDRIGYYLKNENIGNLPLWEVRNLIPSHIPGRVWAMPYGSTVFGLSQEDMKMKEEVRIQIGDVTGNPGETSSFFEDNAKNLWIGTTTGLYVYHISTGTLEVISDELGNVAGITQTSDGRIWAVAKGKGIYRVYPDKKTELFPLNKDFTCVDVTTDGKLWMGTSEGEILMYDSERKEVAEHSIACGMKGDIINNVIVDNYNHIWIITNQAVKEYNPRNGAYRSYYTGTSDFLLNRLLSRASYYDGKGEIFFGGISGIISIPPSQQLESIPEQVVTYITDITVKGKSIWDSGLAEDPLKKSVRINPDDQSLEINFSSLDYHNLEQVRYAYRLEGVDNDWVYPEEGKNSAFYTNLGKGKYVFKVKATDKNGLWSDKITEFTIHRLPAFYETWWAYTLYVMLAIGILWSMLHLYFQQIKQENNKRLMEEVTQMKLRYFTNISHELLTPLTILSCLADEIESPDKGDRKRVGLIQTNIRRLKRLLQQILDLRKIDSKNMKLFVSYGDILAVVRGICEDSFDLLMKNKQIVFSYSAEQEEIKGYFDRDKLDKILFNLLSNAYKYTPQGRSVRLDMQVYVFDRHQYLRIRIQDEGIGIAPKELDRIFTRFYSNRHNKSELSNGIGLSLTKELVELHHGTIAVESQPGKGSLFIVEIPIDKECFTADELKEVDSVKDRVVETNGKEIVEEPETEEEGEKGEYTLLLVEDNAELLLLMKGLFAKTYQVATAENGRIALEYIREHNVDIVVSDIMMPEMDGLELCRTIKSDVATSHIIVVLLTARISTENQISSYEVGADDYIPKPFEPKVLKVRLASLLKQRRKIQTELKNNPKAGLILHTGFTSLDEQLIEKALKIVEENISDPKLDVVTLADHLHVSRSTLSRKIKAITGQTPLDFIKDIKMKYACRMLENKTVTVAEVVIALGYSDHKHFTTSFKEVFGITPSEYQKKLKTQ